MLDAVRPGRQPRLRRHPHPLRRPGVLGPGPDALVVPRRDDGHRGELRLLHRAHPRRRRGAAGAHAPARRGHELRHAGRRRALGRVRDVPPVSRRRGGAGHGAQLRLLRRPHRGAALRHGRGRLRARRHRRRDRPHAGGGGRRHGGRRRRLRLERVADPQRRQRPAGAVPGGRPGRAARPARAGQAVRARRGGAAAGRRLPQRGGLPAPARGRAAVHLDGAAHGEGLPVPREGDRRARRGLGRGGRGVAAGVVPAAGLPDEPVRALHPQHAPDLRRADGQVQGGAGRRLPRPGLARDGLGRRQRQGGRLPAQLGRHLGGRVALAPRAGRPARWRCWPRSGAARRST